MKSIDWDILPRKRSNDDNYFSLTSSRPQLSSKHRNILFQKPKKLKKRALFPTKLLITKSDTDFHEKKFKSQCRAEIEIDELKPHGSF